MLGFRISGEKRVIRKVEQLQRLDKKLQPAMKDAVLYVHSTTPGYPPAPVGSRYHRTGTLGRSVTTMQGQAPGALSRVEPISKGVVGVVGTNVKYGKFVIDRRRQARWNRGRWWTLQGVVDKAKPGIKRILEKAINAVIRG